MAGSPAHREVSLALTPDDTDPDHLVSNVHHCTTLITWVLKFHLSQQRTVAEAQHRVYHSSLR